MDNSAETHLLRALREASPGWVSGQELGREAGVSRAAISKRIRKLLAQGFEVESSPRKGYRLLRADVRLTPGEMARGLATCRFYRHPFHIKEVTQSTNDDLRVLAEQGAPEGTVVFAEVQRAGRGRRGRSWFSRPGDAVQFSLLLRPPIRPGEGTLIPLMAATAVYRTLRNLGVEGVEIKWPNDVLIEGRKVCGILCEMSVSLEGIEYAMLGVGLNVSTPEEAFPPELRDAACSLVSATGKPWSRPQVWLEILKELAPLIDLLWKGEREEILEGWRQGAVSPGQEVELRSANGDVTRGRVQGVNEEGALQLLLPDGTLRTFHSGEVSLRPA